MSKPSMTREVAYYPDLETGAIIERWDNPFTGQTVCVVQVADDPVSHSFPAPYRGRANPFAAFKIDGDVASLRWDPPLEYPNAPQPGEHPAGCE